ncbi:ATP-binding protein [Leptolyngbya sp. 'hensonii']|uniref:sensor histidine kinase n=1 Tax=Leptolyngbya sp. 'hensonii' TaxID=1922337 RepID=UPI000AFCDA7A|nr:ATP-binding protein [Leptolyngbya sp. 'hensonii']
MIRLFGFQSKKRPFRLIRYYTVASLVAFALAIVLLATFYYERVMTDIVALGEQQNVTLATSFSNSLWSELELFLLESEALTVDELRQHGAIEKIRQAAKTQMQGLSVVKIKVFNKKGQTIFSTQTDQIGQDKSASESFQRALTGQVSTELENKRLDHTNTLIQLGNANQERKLLSSYIPVYDHRANNQIAGVFELYSDVTPLIEQLGQAQRYVVLGIILILGGLYGGLFWIVKRADRLIRHQHEALQDSEKNYKYQTLELEKTLKELSIAQSHLIHQEKMSSLGQMVAGVAHEINNPVGFIYGNINYAQNYTETLLDLLHRYQQEHIQPSPELQEHLDTIDLEFFRTDLPKILMSMRHGAERIHQIVLSLRIFSRLDEAELKPVDLHEGINSTLMLLQHRLRGERMQQRIEVIKDYGNLPLVECYAGQLNQVFMHILANAIDALEGAWVRQPVASLAAHGSMATNSERLAMPKITIFTETLDSNFVIVTITDNGPGMTEEVKRKLFDPFFTTKEPGKGTGLGLAISDQIVTGKHNGMLRCFSTVGQGTEFQIKLPIHQRA